VTYSGSSESFLNITKFSGYFISIILVDFF
jgi:hypothetical protein